MILLTILKWLRSCPAVGVVYVYIIRTGTVSHICNLYGPVECSWCGELDVSYPASVL